MKAIRSIVLITLFLVASQAFAMDMEVLHDENVDFTVFKTYAWSEGTAAAEEELQEWIVQTVEEQLESKGFTKAETGTPDLFVQTHVVGEYAVQNTTNYRVSPTWNAGVLTFDSRELVRGTMIVDLIDSKTKEPIWRAQGRKTLNPEIPKAKKLVTKMARQMFRHYPPS